MPTARCRRSSRQLSAGSVAYNLLLGAHALGFGAQWLTGWAAYDRDVAALLGLAGQRTRGRLRAPRHAADRGARTRPAGLADAVDARGRREPPLNGRPAVHLVDASLYVFRAWHSMPDEFLDADGQPVNAVHGFTRFLLELLERARPEHIAVAFDASLTSSLPQRASIRPTRPTASLPPPELKRQFVRCRAIAAALGFHVLVDARYEADDLIGSALWNAARAWLAQRDRVRRQGFRPTARRTRRAMGLRAQPALGRRRRARRSWRASAPGRRLPRADRRRGRQHPRRARHRRQDRRGPAEPFRHPRHAARRASRKSPSCACAARPRAPRSCASMREQALLSRRLTRIALDAPGANAIETLLRGRRSRSSSTCCATSCASAPSPAAGCARCCAERLPALRSRGDALVDAGRNVQHDRWFLRHRDHR